MLHLRKGRYIVRTATGQEDGQGDLSRAQALRGLCFGGADGRADSDSFDPRCTHILIEDSQTQALVSCFRVLPISDPAEIVCSYSAQFYDLTALSGFAGPMLEIGRFCAHPDHHDPDILRIAWATLTQWVDAAGVRLLFGCSSFAGTKAETHLDAFALLHARHHAPVAWQPAIKAAEVFDFATRLKGHSPDMIRAQAGLPPLLRTYLMMGGWVSDHAVYDRDLNTMHVFTGVEIAAIPPTRARLLRAVAL